MPLRYTIEASVRITRTAGARIVHNRPLQIVAATLASVTLAAHLDKLDDEQVLPDGVPRPTFESFDW